MNFWDEYEDPTCSLTNKLKDEISTWDSIVLDEHCLEKMRDEDKLLLEFLTKSDTLTKLVYGALEPVIDLNLPETKQYTLAHRCTEVLCFRLNPFYDAIFAHAEIMTFLAEYLETHKQSLNSLVVSFYCKIFLQLYQYRTVDMITILKTSSFLNAAFDCLNLGSIHELLINLTAKVFPDDRESVKRWLIEADFGSKLFFSIQKLEGDFIALENIGFLWSEYVKALRDYCYSLDANDELLENVQRPDLIEKLLPMMFSKNEQNCALVNCGCLILMGYFESSFDLSQPSMDMTRTMIERPKVFNPDPERHIEHICANYLSNFLQTAYDAWKENDGEIMIACLTVVEFIFNTSQTTNHLKYVEQLKKFDFPKWFTSLASNPTATIAVNCLYNVVGYILHCAPSEESHLLDYLFNDMKITVMILHLMNNEPPNLTYIQKKAFKSFLYRLAERIEQAKRSSQNFMVIRKFISMSDNVQEWADFVEYKLKVYLEDNMPDDNIANQTISDISGQDLYVDEMMDDEDEVKESDDKFGYMLNNDDINKVLDALQKTEATDRPEIDEIDCEPDDFNTSTDELNSTAELFEKLHAANKEMKDSQEKDNEAWPTTSSSQQELEWPAFSPIKKLISFDSGKGQEDIHDWPTNSSVDAFKTKKNEDENDDWPTTSSEKIEKPAMNLFDILKTE